ncbi:tRNA lysidine(34) synthetase TilS [Lederbergia citrea]|uniref:tRNA lysidine(34) synthetase TilS n=1 Tax=Lederbergia citrea TaxID=2833581 RepID=UPI001BC9FF75|nr:tRNA lysidine(34) synthetase TilS [Lederbergia citrea]MBS4206435.1 tRNA lysidine(34) synthetase TilS [Lederbergia citrea]
MLDFEKKTEAFIEKHSLIKAGDYIVAAVSGGPDSLAMLDFLNNRVEKYGIRVAAAHVDHMLRGEESLQDLYFVKNYCESKDIEFRAISIDIRKKMELDETGMQETARKYRYQFFEKVMLDLHADKLAVGQHGDDQLETILMRLVRGSHGKSRAGIQMKRPFAKGELIRPLLGVTKAEIEEYCATHKLNPRRDVSNEKPLYTRNRFRLEILPFLKSENEHVHEQFQRFSEDLTEDEQLLEQMAKKEYNAMCQELGKDEITLNIPSFYRVPLPLQRRVIQLILNYLYQQKAADLTALHIDLLQKLLKSENPSGKLDFPSGLKVIRSYDVCHFTFDKPGQVSSFCYKLYEGEEVSLPDGKIIRVEKGQGLSKEKKENIIVLNPSEVQFPIIVRTRLPGDRMKLKGMNGSKKVKDIFIDMKIPLHDRLVWPIVTDNTGKLLWIPGLKKSSYDTSPDNEHHFYSIHCSNQTFSGGQPNQ